MPVARDDTLLNNDVGQGPTLRRSLMTPTNDSLPAPSSDSSPTEATEATEASNEPETSATARAARARHAINIGVIIAVAGLIFSGVTYVFNRRDQQKADERRARTELTEVIGDIVALPRLYPNNQVDAFANSQFRSEMVVLVGAAERLTSEFPQIAGPADYLALGYANNNLLNLTSAIDEFARAEDLALVAGDAGLTAAARFNAGISYFLLGQLPRGRRMFTRALSLSGLDGVPDSVVVAQQPSIRTSWALAEATVGQCIEARRQLAVVANTPGGAQVVNQVRSQPSWPCG